MSRNTESLVSHNSSDNGFAMIEDDGLDFHADIEVEYQHKQSKSDGNGDGDGDGDRDSDKNSSAAANTTTATIAKVEKPQKCSSASVAYAMVLGFLCLSLLVILGFWLHTFSTGCWPCATFSSEPQVYLEMPGITSLSPAWSRILPSKQSCNLDPGSYEDALLVAGQDPETSFGYLKLFNGLGTDDQGEEFEVVDLIRASDHLLVKPKSIAVDWCSSDIFVSDGGTGAIYKLECALEHPAWEYELCTDFSPTLLEFDHIPNALASLPECMDGDTFYLFVAGIENTGRKSFLQRIEISETVEDTSGYQDYKLYPALNGSTGDGVELVNPQGLALDITAGTIYVANTDADEILLFKCGSSIASACFDFTDASSRVIASVLPIASISKPKSLFKIESENVEVFDRLYIAGGGTGEGYIAYLDLSDNYEVHYIIAPGGIVEPAGLFYDLFPANKSGTVGSQIDSDAQNGLFSCDVATGQVLRLPCNSIVADYT